MTTCLQRLFIFTFIWHIHSAAGVKFTGGTNFEVDQRSLRGTVKRCMSMGSVLCTQNNVSVLEQVDDVGKRKRSLRFGNECATESSVVCKNSKDCGNSCAACPCDVDVSAGLSESYMRTMFEQMSASCSDESARVLMLGLGGGELSLHLLHHCPGMNIDAVELNGDVISLARSYFGVGESERKFEGRLTIEQADALSAAKERAQAAGEGYDFVLVDCFSGGGEVPESCRSRELAKTVKQILKPGGEMLQNIWHYSKMRQQVSAEFEETKAIYTEVFDGALGDLVVPLPPQIQWVDILRAKKKDEDLGETLDRLNKEEKE